MEPKTLIFVNNFPAMFYLNKIKDTFTVLVTLEVKDTKIDVFRYGYKTFYEALSVLLEKLIDAEITESTSRVEEGETGFDLATLQRMIAAIQPKEGEQ